MGSVEIQSARKKYGALEVLHGVDAHIADGEFVALVGPSGCGKSTLLRMIAGLEDITEGTISVAGRVVNDVSPKERDIAMVFQSYALYPHMTVAKNMSFALRLAGAPKEEIDRRVADAARILGLDAYLERYPRQLSGGQRQRVAMGRAIVRDPEVFLFDEPLSNLDANLRVQMRSEIKALHHRLGTTTIYVTHDQIEAMTLADRIVVMHDGRIEQIGTPLALYDEPVNTFVASFIGSPAMNLIEGRVENGAFRTASGEMALTSAIAAKLNDQRVVLGIRPEHLRLDANGSEAEVKTVEPTGSETLVHMVLACTLVTGLFRERIRIAPGEVIHVSPDPETLHVFDAGGARICIK